MLDLVVLMQLLETARDLHDPSDAGGNPEYTRGQVNLICDVSGVPLAMDTIGDAVERYITHADDRLSGVVAKIALGRSDPA